MKLSRFLAVAAFWRSHLKGWRRNECARNGRSYGRIGGRCSRFCDPRIGGAGAPSLSGDLNRFSAILAGPQQLAHADEHD